MDSQHDPHVGATQYGVPMATDATRLAGRYQLTERIGAGGMGEVWRATDELLGRTVAIKLILPDLLDEPGFLRRFLAEARAMASVRHPGVVAIHDFHGDDAGAYLVMEYVEGDPLSRVLSRSGRLSAERTMDLLRQAALALQAVHDRGIVHRDVKPANLMVRPDSTIAVADFGIALGTAHTALTNSGAVLGTPAYLAPEQVLGQAASPRSDVYALGVVGYECLTGRRPFVGDNPYAVAMQRVGHPPPPLDADVPPAAARVIERAMQPDPSLRWPSAAEFAAAAHTAGVGRMPAGLGRAPVSSGRKRPSARVAVIAAALALAIATGVAGWLAWPHGKGDGGPGGAGQDGARGQIPNGYVTCGDALCPTAPMCWRGLVQNGDKGLTPGVSDCADPHYWETFVAAVLPADATTDKDLTTLMSRPDIAALCSTDALAAHSRDPAATDEWRREAWPIPADAYTVLVHCLAGSPDGESPGSAFTPGG
jgi:serine/threonine-protein kinase